MDDDQVKRFAALFTGSPRAHGCYNVGTAAGAGNKVEGDRWTAKRPANLAGFRGHLNGDHGLGAVPLLLDPPGHTWWGAIDVDDYSLDVAAYARQVAARELPLIPCRTKSGGVHLYLFLNEPCDAKLVRVKLREWAAVVGYPTAEVFPKQDRLSEKETDGDSYWGNWINLPYQSGARSTRYALDDQGMALTLGEFLDRAELTRLSEQELFHREPVAAAPDTRYPGAPPCLVRMATGGVVSGGRNQALFTAALYYKRLDPTRCHELTEAFNRTVLVPPLTTGEVQVIVRSAQRKDYNYRCKEHPMAGLCDRAACEDEAYGVKFGRGGSGGRDGELALELGPLVKILTHPPIWRWQVEGEWVELSTQELTTQKAFLLRVLEVTNKRVRPAKSRAWEQILDDAIAASTVEVPPAEATAEGQLMVHLARFCTGRAQARSLDELLLGKPYTDKELHRTCFVPSDLLAYLIQQRVSGVTERWLYTRLRERDLEAHDAVLKGKSLAYWSVPEFDVQTEPFEVPREDVASFT